MPNTDNITPTTVDVSGPNITDFCIDKITNEQNINVNKRPRSFKILANIGVTLVIGYIKNLYKKSKNIYTEVNENDKK